MLSEADQRLLKACNNGSLSDVSEAIAAGAMLTASATEV